MMTYSRGNQVVLVGIGTWHQELRHSIAYGRLLDMFSQCPPAEVPHLLEAAVRTIEEGHVLRHPVPRFRVRNGLHNVFILHCVEIVDIVLVVVITEESGSLSGQTAEHTDRSGGKSGNGEGRLWVCGASIFKGVVPISRGVNIWETALGTSAEHHTFDTLHRGKEHSLACLLAININLNHTLRDAEYGFDMISLVGLIFAQTAIASSTLATHLTFIC